MLLKHESLAQMALFAGLSDSEVQALAQRSVERRFAAEEMLFWEGEPCTGIFLLTQGSVKIFKTSAAGREMMLSLETAPSSVAELPLFDGGPYPASVRAVGPVLALFINKSDFHQVCRQFPDVALKLLAVVGRLARLLLDASVQAGTDEFDLPLTHQELASRLGTVREVVSRNLARFRAEGLVQIQGHQLRIVDRESLEREAEAQG
jgi:CRP/FNR family transcriptional regulator